MASVTQRSKAWEAGLEGCSGLNGPQRDMSMS